jgi:hypothetical protein
MSIEHIILIPIQPIFALTFVNIACLAVKQQRLIWLDRARSRYRTHSRRAR